MEAFHVFPLVPVRIYSVPVANYARLATTDLFYHLKHALEFFRSLCGSIVYSHEENPSGGNRHELEFGLPVFTQESVGDHGVEDERDPSVSTLLV